MVAGGGGATSNERGGIGQGIALRLGASPPAKTPSSPERLCTSDPRAGRRLVPHTAGASDSSSRRVPQEETSLVRLSGDAVTPIRVAAQAQPCAGRGEGEEGGGQSGGAAPWHVGRRRLAGRGMVLVPASVLPRVGRPCVRKRAF